ncbi:MAG: phosphoglycerate mutase family protein [Bacilli bacterium]|nr:phosphoglycerate mutase family protein [Bacilli bacterium]
MRVYIVRHGEVSSNVEKVYNRVDDYLNENGINQAKALGEKMRAIDYDVIISSPLIRAKETSQIINFKNKDILYDARLSERDAGSFKGKSLDLTNRDEYWNYNTELVQGDEENIRDFFKRVWSFLDELKSQNYESVVISCHSGVSKAIRAYFEGLEDGFFLNKGLKNGEISLYNF